MVTSVLTLTFGIILLLYSTRHLVSLSQKISFILKISPLVIGLTIVAIGTSIPELAVSTVALFKNDVGLATGNIIGSNVINILLVLPAGIIFGKLRVGTTKTQKNALLLVLITLLFIFLKNMNLNNRLLGLFLMSLSFVVTVVEYFWAINGRVHEDARNISKIRQQNFGAGDFATILFSLAGIVVGGYITVISTEDLSALTGYSTTILGLSLTAVATSLPELFTSIFSQKNKLEKVTIGNVIGSNIYNLLLIGGIITFFSPSTNIETTDWIILGSTTVGFWGLLKLCSGRIIPKKIGVVLLILFVGYILWLST